MRISPPDPPVCDAWCVHTDVTSKALAGMPDEDTLIDLAELYKIFGDSTRAKILFLLYEAPMCVCDIAESLSMTPSAISHQLRILKNAKLVAYRREGKTVIYALQDDHVGQILRLGLEHVRE